MRKYARFNVLIALNLALLICASISPARAIYQGTEAVGDNRVLAIVSPKDNPRSGCSGSLLAPQIVVSAAHCLGNPNHIYPEAIYQPESLYVAQPGADLNKDDVSTRVQVLRAIVTPNYDNTWSPQTGNENTQKDDLAFYFLAKPLVTAYSIEIANAEEVALVKQNNMTITHIGYGLQDNDSHNGKPYLARLNAFSQGSSRYSGTPALESMTVATQEIGSVALCPGDSGSPWYATFNGIEKIVAVTVSASGCHGPGSGLGGTMGTLIYPYLPSLEKQWKQFLVDLPGLIKSTTVVQNIDESLPLIQRSGGCDAKIDAVLQIQKDGKWDDFMAAQGLARVDGCDAMHPYQPWVRARVATGTLIRWRLFSKGNWEVFTDPINYVAPAIPTPTPSPSPIPTPISKASPSPSAPVKKTFLLCYKGRTVQKVVAINPVCPKGYRKK